MIDEEVRDLLRVSYDNNQMLLDIDKKLRNNSATIDDISILLNMRDAKKVWTMTTINMVATSFLFTGIAKLAFDLPNKDLRLMILSLGISSIVFGYLKYREELKEQERIHDIVHLNPKVGFEEEYNKEQLEILKKEQKALNQVRNIIISQEEEINDYLSNNEKKLIKK